MPPRCASICHPAASLPVCLPGGIREQMVQAFRDHYQEAVETNGESKARYGLGVVGDESKSLTREHRVALERILSTKTFLFSTLAIALLVFGFLLVTLSLYQCILRLRILVSR